MSRKSAFVPVAKSTSPEKVTGKSETVPETTVGPKPGALPSVNIFFTGTTSSTSSQPSGVNISLSGVTPGEESAVVGFNTLRFQKEAQELLDAFRKETAEIVDRATKQMQAIEAEYAERARKRRAKGEKGGKRQKRG